MFISWLSKDGYLCDDDGVTHVAHCHDALGWVPLCVVRDVMHAFGSVGNRAGKRVQFYRHNVLVCIAHATLTCVFCVVGGAVSEKE